jgi:hypothetical protein
MMRRRHSRAFLSAGPFCRGTKANLSHLQCTGPHLSGSARIADGGLNSVASSDFRKWQRRPNQSHTQNSQSTAFGRRIAPSIARWRALCARSPIGTSGCPSGRRGEKRTIGRRAAPPALIQVGLLVVARIQPVDRDRGAVHSIVPARTGRDVLHPLLLGDLRQTGLGEAIPRVRHVEQHVSLCRRARSAGHHPALFGVLAIILNLLHPNRNAGKRRAVPAPEMKLLDGSYARRRTRPVNAAFRLTGVEKP